jgi:hypothetical protein
MCAEKGGIEQPLELDRDGDYEAQKWDDMNTELVGYDSVVRWQLGAADAQEWQWRLKARTL